MALIEITYKIRYDPDLINITGVLSEFEDNIKDLEDLIEGSIKIVEVDIR